MTNSYFQYLCSQLENEIVIVSFKKEAENLIGKVVKTSEGYLLQKNGCLFKLDHKRVKDVKPLGDMSWEEK